MQPKSVQSILRGAALGVLLLGALLLLDLFVLVPDFSGLNKSVPVNIRLADGTRSTRLVGPTAPGWVDLSHISPFLPRAVVASEDASFYSHKGIDVYEMQEAFKKDLKEGRFARGASTLTQQVLKNVYLSQYPRLWRKVKEIAWAWKLEGALSKPQILTFYLNMAEWGPGIYGVEQAAHHYFSTVPSALTARQSAFLAMLLPSPRRYHSYFKEKRLTEWAAKRVNRILQVMNKLGQLPDEQFQVAMQEQLWGAPVLSDTAPGAPTDPGWDVSESPDEVFEVAPPAIPAVESTPLGESPEPAAPPSEPAASPLEPEEERLEEPGSPADEPEEA